MSYMHGTRQFIASRIWALLITVPCCLWKPGEGDLDSLADFGWVTCERCIAFGCTFRVSLAGLGPWASPQGLKRTQSAKWETFSETLHISDPTSLSLVYTFSPSHISLPPPCLNTSIGHTIVVLATADIPCLNMHAVLAVQLPETANFSLEEWLWTLITIEYWTSVLQNSCLMCSDKVHELPMIFKDKKRGECDNVLSECLSATI